MPYFFITAVHTLPESGLVFSIIFSSSACIPMDNYVCITYVYGRDLRLKMGVQIRCNTFYTQGDRSPIPLTSTKVAL